MLQVSYDNWLTAGLMGCSHSLTARGWEWALRRCILQTTLLQLPAQDGYSRVVESRSIPLTPGDHSCLMAPTGFRVQKEYGHASLPVWCSILFVLVTLAVLAARVTWCDLAYLLPRRA